MKHILGILLLSLYSSFSMANNLAQHFNFDGFLTDPSDNPRANATVNLKFQIYNPAGTCLLFEETHSSVVLDANGGFSLKVGTGARNSAADGAATYKQVFQNTSSIRGTDGTYCPSPYIPAAGDVRKLRVTVDSDTLSPDYILSPAPLATVAESLQGKIPADFLLSSPSGPQTTSDDLQINGALKLGNSGFAIDLVAPTLAGSYSLSFPATDGSNGQVLATNGAGVLSWTTPGGGGSASSITFTPAGGITGANVQAAVAEVDAEKVSKAGDTMTGVLNLPANGLNVASGQLGVFGGFVGIGTQVPEARLHVAGSIKLGNGAESCVSPSESGLIRYNTGILQVCDGASWQNLSTASTAISTLNGQTGNSQTFSSGLTGTAPNWSSAANTHVLNIPMASDLGVTAGLISKIDYDSFSGKLESGSVISAANGSAAAPGFTFSSDTNTGIYSLTADSLYFATNGVGRMYLDSNGALNINKGTNAESLNITGNSGSVAARVITTSDTPTDTTKVYGFRKRTAGGVVAGDSLFKLSAHSDGTSGGGAYTAGSIEFKADTSAYTNHVPGRIEFNVTNTAGTNVTSMTITNSGNVGIGSASPAVALDVVGDVQYTGALTDVSDLRLKSDVQPLNDALERFSQIRGVSFVMKDDPKRQIENGVIAQEVEPHFPELVKTKNDEMGSKSVNYIGFIGWLIEAVKELSSNDQEQADRLSQLETKAELLERENLELKSRLLEIERKLSSE